MLILSLIAIYGNSQIAGRIAVVTTLGPAAGALSTIFVGRIISYREQRDRQTFSLSDACNGVLAGTVAITSGCAVVRALISL